MFFFILLLSGKGVVELVYLRRSIVIANGQEVSDLRVETDRVRSLLRIADMNALRSLVLKDIGWTLLRQEQVVDVDATRVRDSDKDAGSEWRPLHLHHILVVTRLKDNDRSLVERVIHSDGAI